MSQRQKQIEEILQANFEVIHLEVVNESHMHSVPANSETHFKVVLVSPDFEGVGRVQRQQKVYSLLQDELNSGLHALAQKTYTPEEWQKVNPEILDSPDCHGGSKN